MTGHGEGGFLHRPDHAVVGATTAQVLVQCLHDISPTWVGLGLQQGRRRSDDACNAIAALGCVFFQEGSLERVGMFGRAQALQGGHLSVLYRPERQIAGGLWSAIDQHGTRTTFALATSKFRAAQTQVITQD